MIYRALLLTDVVDSTKVAEELGDEAFALLWAQHDRSARDLLRVWRGREVDKTDGFLAMFDSVADVCRVKRTVLDRLRRSGRVTEILG